MVFCPKLLNHNPLAQHTWKGCLSSASLFEHQGPLVSAMNKPIVQFYQEKGTLEHASIRGLKR